ncbi:TerB family tellurite resistance protein [Gammaproteobacteria bacterium]|nr:TerB family tellurite resistance protein [Gammaproteobacteria bacterium]MDC1007625.1 TerB family tellurite resistance protein [Gammaproteobacteria bacterium]
MFNIFKKKYKKEDKEKRMASFDIELTASVLAYEIARSDGEISKSELAVLLEEIKRIGSKVKKTDEEILKIIEEFSNNSISFHEFVEDINKNYSKKEKLTLITFLWSVAYADFVLEVNEERLIRRIADLIHIKDIDVLKIKNRIKNL